MMKYLNLGCGTRFHKDWTNVDFTVTGKDVIAHNLLSGIPFETEKFDVVYHSHVLEHFSKKDGEKFIENCYDVLKPNGIIRIAVPDLEKIAREYIRNLDRSAINDPTVEDDYDWIMLEMYDQTVRNQSGGEMAKYLQREFIPNANYVFNRIGLEGKSIHTNYVESLKNKPNDFKSDLNKFELSVIQKIKKIFSKKEVREQSHAEKIGDFRLSGEIHQWMYDKYSLGKLLKMKGFKEIKIRNAFESYIPDWSSFQLDTDGEVLRKPDSLYMEGIK